MAEVQSIIDYYVNLLIIQYHNKPKARATIEALVKEAVASGIFLDIRDAYSVETAVGVQLDVIGQYVGVNRFFEDQDLVNFFGLTFYTEVDPDSEDKFGFTTYADFEDYNYNGTLNYSSILSVTNRLSDDDFRVIIKLKILQNNINHSHKEIDESVYAIFGDEVRPDSEGDMQMVYFITANLSAILKAALYKKLLPRPIGVGISLITDVTEPFFGFATYDYESPHILGFTDYAGYDNSDGQTLIYDQITPG